VSNPRLVCMTVKMVVDRRAAHALPVPLCD
jgi:hypothetical protein